MEQLPGSDAVFLSLENETTSGHIGGLSVLDAANAPGFSIDRLVQTLVERVSYEPRFSMKLQPAPLGLDRPYLMEDRAFDPMNHIHRVAVPASGSMREVGQLLGYLHQQKLDRSLPLWEAWVLEQMEDGRVGLYLKVHHALMDGESGQALMQIMNDLEPEPEGPFADRYEAAFGPRPAPAPRISNVEIGLRTARSVAETPRRVAAMAGSLMKTAAVSQLQRWLDIDAPPASAPRLRVNGRISKRRAFACSRVSLADVKAVKQHYRTTVNDVVLAVTADAMREHLLERDELPKASLVAMIPISTRAKGDASPGNQITSAPVSWATEIEDPVARLEQIHRNAERTKRFAKQFDSDLLGNIGKALPPVFASALLDFAPSAAPVIGNVTISNVRGTPFPLFTAGARIEAMFPISLLTDTQGLNITVVSYDGNLDFGLTVDPSLLPDVWRLAERIPVALERLVKAMDRLEVEAPPARATGEGVPDPVELLHAADPIGVGSESTHEALPEPGDAERLAG